MVSSFPGNLSVTATEKHTDVSVNVFVITVVMVTTVVDDPVPIV
jgi:hypothetical protein